MRTIVFCCVRAKKVWADDKLQIFAYFFFAHFFPLKTSAELCFNVRLFTGSYCHLHFVAKIKALKSAVRIRAAYGFVL